MASTKIRFSSVLFASLASSAAAAAMIACTGGYATEPSAGPGPSVETTGADGGALGAADGGDVETFVAPPLKETEMASGLADGGLDIAALPPLDKLDHPGLHAVMHGFDDALGYAECSGCHAPGQDGGKYDFDAWTPNKRIAARMWTDYVQGLETKDGKPVYCDSCHQGKAEFLNRSDEKAVGKYMHENFVDGLKTKDGKDVTCGTCHGKPFDPAFLKKWGQAD